MRPNETETGMFLKCSQFDINKFNNQPRHLIVMLWIVDENRDQPNVLKAWDVARHILNIVELWLMRRVVGIHK